MLYGIANLEFFNCKRAEELEKCAHRADTFGLHFGNTVTCIVLGVV